MRVPSGSTFGRRLRALRMAQDMSQVELARRIGRHQTAIGPYERDEYEPPRDVVEKLALVLETSPEYLYFGRSPPQIALPVVGRIGRAGCSRPHPRRPWSCCSCVTSSCAATGCVTTAWRRCSGPRQIALALAARGRRSGHAARARCAGRACRRAHPAAAAAAECGSRPVRPCGLQRAPSTDGRSAGGEIHCRCPWPEAWRDARCRRITREHIPYG